MLQKVISWNPNHHQPNNDSKFVHYGNFPEHFGLLRVIATIHKCTEIQWYLHQTQHQTRIWEARGRTSTSRTSECPLC